MLVCDHRIVPQSYVIDGYRRGQWVSVQRAASVNGSLEPARVKRLHKLKGWSWTARADRWEMTYKVLLEYIKEHGNARVSNTCQVNGVKLGTWVVEQRGAFKRGVLCADGRRSRSLPLFRRIVYGRRHPQHWRIVPVERFSSMKIRRKGSRRK